MKSVRSVLSVVLIAMSFVSVAAAHTFEISNERDAFLYDGKPFQMRCGEVHYVRIPREYWRHRLQMLRAMGCNAVGCYMFWNFHERKEGEFTWTGRADAAEFCRLAQEEGLLVVLRPGPYACAEWEGGGAPWFLLKNDGISMRSSDPRWLAPAKKWIAEVGAKLAPLQITRGGPIVMVQVENEYGLHGNDVNYIRALRQATIDAGFEVPLYSCNPPRVMGNGFVPEIFQAANFGGAPKERFAVLRTYQPHGPLFCSEYYPAWFDTWGQSHHNAKSDSAFFGPIDWMLENGASFSLYMAHGGTSFGGWTGCRNPFVPNVTSYDYEAPINEQGRANPSYAKFRERCAKHLNDGETIPDMPAAIPVRAYGEIAMGRVAHVDAIATRSVEIERPVYMEKLDQGFGLVSYERLLEAEDCGMLNVSDIHDFGYVFLDDVRLGTFDRRHRGMKFKIEKSKDGKRRLLRILVEAMGRINSSQGMEDRKGMNGKVTLGKRELKNWNACMMPIDPDSQSFDFTRVPYCPTGDAPAFYRGTMNVDEVADTYFDMGDWSKGIVWINGHNLGRFWCIGPQQTLYVPGCWLKKGGNEVTVLDFFGPRVGSSIRAVDAPILNKLDNALDFNVMTRPTKKFVGGTEVAAGTFVNDGAAQVVMFKSPAEGSKITIQIVSTYDKKNLAAIGELDFLDANGNPITSLDLSIGGVDSDEEIREDGAAENAIDGQVEASWTTSSRELPHWIEFSNPSKFRICGIRYTPRQDKVGRIRDFKVYVR